MTQNRNLFPKPAEKQELEEGQTFTPKFDADGLIPAIVTDDASGEVLMFAFMNAEALDLTLQTRFAHFYSRSRGKLWKKGEDSGNTLAVSDIRTDCDQDVVWLSASIAGHGAACHTGRKTCFYRSISQDPDSETRYKLKEVVSDRAFSPADVYKK
ncbi:MAG: phosphoribosyl-AMP cyclohydrolase [Filomicrobium sp.]